MNRVISGEPEPFEATDRALRPQTLAEFVGQEPIKANLQVFIDAARGRGESLDHVLLFGPPGLGKTTLAQIVARELGVNFRATSGPVLAKASDLAAILSNLEPRDVLFIDEIHRLPPAVEEILYPAMEDHVLDLVIGDGPAARSLRIDLAPFTLVAATTRAGMLATPLRDRFGIPLRLEFYTPEELKRVLEQAARKMGAPLTADGAAEIAARARGTPRVAGRARWQRHHHGWLVAGKIRRRRLRSHRVRRALRVVQPLLRRPGRGRLAPAQVRQRGRDDLVHRVCVLWHALWHVPRFCGGRDVQRALLCRGRQSGMRGQAGLRRGREQRRVRGRSLPRAV